MATDSKALLRADLHSVEPIPESDKDSTGPQQKWIWARANIAPIYRDPDQSAYGDINRGGIAASVVGLIAGWSVEDGLVPALQGPVSTRLLGGADLSWLVGIVVAGAVSLALSRRPVTAAVPRPVGSR